MTDNSVPARQRSSRESELRSYVVHLPRHTKQIIMLVADAVGFYCCVLMVAWVYLIRPWPRIDFILLSVASMLFAHLVARQLGFYHTIVRYLGMGLLYAGAKVAVSSAIFLSAAAWFFGMTGTPFRLAFVYGAFCGLYLVGSRYSAQYLLLRRAAGRDKVIIWGAGESGAGVVHSMHGSQSFRPVVFVDDNPAMVGKQVNGLRVYPSDDIERLIRQYSVSRVLLAIPRASRKQRRRIVARLEPMSVHVQTVPDFNDLITGKARVDDIRDVDVEDLLTRPPVAPDESLMQATLLDKAVLVTGAGGSIGSELCRQILRVGPKVLVLFEISEVALYSIDKELRALAKKNDIDTEVVPLLGSVQEQHRVAEVMDRFEIDTVYHAAAYKHVPMVEQNIVEGACNNVLGTLRTAKAAIGAGVETFILVSTDKAVSPTNVMGATKRLAEQTLQAMQETTDTICFSMVRFGNVLESSGSVVPLFREQIKHGGPVTVTHPEIIRYFMTIPEAAQLVIQAGAMAEGGDVFVLDMGEPVKIVELAKRMINLAGLTIRTPDNPDGDIEIEFTGLRPAEKLYEELLIGENVLGTEHPRIMRAEEHFTPADVLMPMLLAVEDAARGLDRVRMREILEATVKEYRPSDDINDLLWDTSSSLDVVAFGKSTDNVH
jgi:FlaA1/EpsC-like NDP-sugar epimerase